MLTITKCRKAFCVKTCIILFPFWTGFSLHIKGMRLGQTHARTKERRPPSAQGGGNFYCCTCIFSMLQ